MTESDPEDDASTGTTARKQSAGRGTKKSTSSDSGSDSRNGKRGGARKALQSGETASFQSCLMA